MKKPHTYTIMKFQFFPDLDRVHLAIHRFDGHEHVGYTMIKEPGDKKMAHVQNVYGGQGFDVNAHNMTLRRKFVEVQFRIDHTET